MRQMRASLIIASLGLALGACGSSGGSSAGSSSVTTTVVASTASTMTDPAVDDADVEFAQGMIAHHEQAIEMSELALDPKAAAGTAVKNLATRIKAAQDPEIQQMTAWLKAHNKTVEMAMDDSHNMASMPGMMSAGDMDGLATKTGGGFDAAWLTMMIAHHTGAIEMSTTVKAKGADGELRALAENIITAQQAEIAQMKGIIAG